MPSESRVCTLRHYLVLPLTLGFGLTPQDEGSDLDLPTSPGPLRLILSTVQGSSTLELENRGPGVKAPLGIPWPEPGLVGLPPTPSWPLTCSSFSRAAGSRSPVALKSKMRTSGPLGEGRGWGMVREGHPSLFQKLPLLPPGPAPAAPPSVWPLYPRGPTPLSWPSPDPDPVLLRPPTLSPARPHAAPPRKLTGWACGCGAAPGGTSARRPARCWRCAHRPGTR